MSPSLHEIALAYFEADEWYPEADGVDQVLVAVAGEHGEFQCFTQAFEERGLLVFFAVAPLIVPPERSAAVMEFVTRANWGLMVGNFEYHIDDGLVRYRAAVDLESVEAELRTVDLVAPMLGDVAHTAAAMLDQHLGALGSVVDGISDPLSALLTVGG